MTLTYLTLSLESQEYNQSADPSSLSSLLHHICYPQTDGETVADFIFLGSKITADGDCSHEMKRRILLGRKVMTNLDSILKAETLLCQQRSI